MSCANPHALIKGKNLLNIQNQYLIKKFLHNLASTVKLFNNVNKKAIVIALTFFLLS